MAATSLIHKFFFMNLNLYLERSLMFSIQFTCNIIAVNEYLVYLLSGPYNNLTSDVNS